ncbi:MAG: hypothetical protein HDR22_10410 [Lachnospiraceae bacterium]|nr:hypothetical protein [Lachnospiraceae bacterium]
MKIKGLSGNALKVIAAITMTIDHVGMILFPQTEAFRMVGRIAFPLFAFFIAEGCRYTHNKRKYLGMILFLGLIFHGVFVLATGQTMFNIFITFSFSIVLIYFLQNAIKAVREGTWQNQILSGSLFFGMLFLTYLFTSRFVVDYGFFGIMLPVLVSLPDSLWKRKAAFLIGALLLVLSMHTYIQSFCLLAVPILFFYNGKRGKYKMKYFFYIFYPLHLSLLFLLDIMI